MKVIRLKNKLKNKKNEREFRFAGVDEVRFETDETGIVTGYPVVFNKPANIGGLWTEYIEPGALDECDLRDVQFLVNHDDSGITLARSRNNNANSTMQLTVDEIGLRMEARLDIENNSEARALHSAISRGDISGMSFLFYCDADRWDDLDSDNPVRHIEKISYIREISAVNSPAYPDTSIQARSLDNEAVLENARSVLDNTNSAQLELAKAKNKIFMI